MKGSFRFHPPPVEVTDEVRHVLACAFAEPAPRSEVSGIDPGGTVRLARQLGLDARIGARLRRDPTDSRLDALADASRRAAASGLRARAAAEAVAEAAGARGIPCCFLKGVALEGLGVTAPGARPMCDTDVLVGPADVEALSDSLRRAGFAVSGEEYPHQLAALVHPDLGAVEIHRHLPGVRVGASPRFAQLDDLELHQLTVPWTALPGRASLPDRAVLAAHLIAHGLAQHGFRPSSYPPLRLLGDLLDLGIAAAGGGALLDRALPLVVASVPEREARAAAALCAALAASDFTLLDDGSDAGSLLRHFLAGTLEPRYRAALTLQDLRHPLGERGPVGNALSAAGTALALSREQIDAVYGRPRTRWGYAARRVMRPFDLIRRAGRALLSHVRKRA